MKNPYLSIVVAARNDNHGGDMHDRMQLFINALNTHAAQFALPVELIVVNWNPPDGRPLLQESFAFPTGNPYLSTRIITVPIALHMKYRSGHHLGLYQMIAKNVGIRRANAPFVLATNVDIVFSRELMAFLAEQRLENRVLYRVDRYDVEKQLLSDLPLEEVLAYCETHVTQIATLLGPVKPLSEVQLAARVQAYLAKCQAAGLKVFHANASGDFQLLDRESWFRCYGYVEMDRFPIRIDSLFHLTAHAAGIQESCLPSPMRIYHMEHTRGCNTKESVSEITRYYNQAGVRLMTAMEYNFFKQKMAYEGDGFFKTPDWGLAGFEFPEWLLDSQSGWTERQYSRSLSTEGSDNASADISLVLLDDGRLMTEGSLWQNLTVFVDGLSGVKQTVEIQIVSWGVEIGESLKIVLKRAGSDRPVAVTWLLVSCNDSFRFNHLSTLAQAVNLGVSQARGRVIAAGPISTDFSQVNMARLFQLPDSDLEVLKTALYVGGDFMTAHRVLWQQTRGLPIIPRNREAVYQVFSELLKHAKVSVCNLAGDGQISIPIPDLFQDMEFVPFDQERDFVPWQHAMQISDVIRTPNLELPQQVPIAFTPLPEIALTDSQGLSRAIADFHHPKPMTQAVPPNSVPLVILTWMSALCEDNRLAYENAIVTWQSLPCPTAIFVLAHDSGVQALAQQYGIIYVETDAAGVTFSHPALAGILKNPAQLVAFCHPRLMVGSDWYRRLTAISHSFPCAITGNSWSITAPIMAWGDNYLQSELRDAILHQGEVVEALHFYVVQKAGMLLPDDPVLPWSPAWQHYWTLRYRSQGIQMLTLKMGVTTLFQQRQSDTFTAVDSDPVLLAADRYLRQVIRQHTDYQLPFPYIDPDGQMQFALHPGFTAIWEDNQIYEVGQEYMVQGSGTMDQYLKTVLSATECYGRGDFSSAMGNLERIAQMSDISHIPGVFYLWAKCCQATGQTEQARQLLEREQSLGHDPQLARLYVISQ